MLRALLLLYPASFRNEYAAEMADDLQRRKRRVSGPFGMLLFWLDTVVDTLHNAMAAHWDLLRQDLRYAARKMAQAPGFALAVVLLTALGIGATTAVFTITDRVLIRPLPFPDSARLVMLWENLPGYGQMELSPPNYADWKARATGFESMGAYTQTSVNLADQGEPLRLNGAAVMPGLFETLQVQPLMGRFFHEEEAREGGERVVLLSHQLWLTTFGADPALLGKKVLIDDQPSVIIGVMPVWFRFPSREVRLWVPLRMNPRDASDRNNNFLEVVGRRKAGVSLEQVRAELQSVTAQLEREYPKENAKTRATVFAMGDGVSDRARLMLGVLSGASICVLLIACSNLANLLMARALNRRKELAVRSSLGAGRERLTRQLLTESLFLAALGGVAGVFLAHAAVPLLMRLVPVSLPVAEPAVDLRVLLFAMTITLLTGIAFGVLPALRVCRDAAGGLQEGQRAGAGPRSERLRSALVFAELAVSMLLLVSAGLLFRSLVNVKQVDPGFQTANILTLRTALPAPKYDRVAVRHQFYDRVLGEIKALPGVTDAAYISFLPMTMRGGIWPVGIGKVEVERSGNRSASLRFVTPGFFRTLSIPLLTGRDVASSDSGQSLPVAVVSQSFVEKHFAGQNPLGQRFNFAFQERTIVGVVGDVRVRGLERESEPQVYLPSTQVPDASLNGYTPKDLTVKTTGDPLLLLQAMRRIIHDADPAQPISDVRLLSEIVEADSLPRTTQVRVLGAFAAAAILLACIGIHGLLSFAVSSRSREIGIRVALGASPSNILNIVLGRSMLLSGLGIAAGFVLSLGAGRWLQSLLVGVPPADSVSFLTAGLVTLAMALAGTLLPALRALRVDPVAVMRSE